MLTHRIPSPPHTGDKTRAYHVARHLATKHDVTLAFRVEDPAAFAARTMDLLKRLAEHKALTRAARGFVQAEHSWESSLARLDTLFSDLASSCAPTETT